MTKSMKSFLEISTNMTKYHNKLPEDIKEVPNIIIYGPKQTLKYSSALNIVSKYSETNLAYEKKIKFMLQTTEYSFKMSDCHFEFDFELSGCNTKALWFEFTTFIKDIIKIKNKPFFVICKNFHCINQELLTIFYSYMQINLYDDILKFILLTEHVSFIPYSIESRCYTIYKKKKKDHTEGYMNYSKIMKPFIHMIENKKIDYQDIRNNLYELMIYNVDMNDSFYYLIEYCIINQKINLDLKNIQILYGSLEHYHNNYRPIYHLEFFIVSLLKLTNEFK